MAKKNYYVVCEGKNRGIFDQWYRCSNEIENYRGAIYRGFMTLGEAVSYALQEMGYGERYILSIRGKEKDFYDYNAFFDFVQAVQYKRVIF